MLRLGYHWLDGDVVLGVCMGYIFWTFDRRLFVWFVSIYRLECYEEHQTAARVSMEKAGKDWVEDRK